MKPDLRTTILTIPPGAPVFALILPAEKRARILNRVFK
ncbi:MAG: hypothetical protein BWX84_00438 [Verrucomicrobia bacterium ADurb.Bin118]|jgi:hypothetical protein|nr:MAG: hypothetical protein BWX84_00438 [Verrucomicrobia bacterium ADurb.Bin118]